jgi:hypothetical protein
MFVEGYAAWVGLQPAADPRFTLCSAECLLADLICVRSRPLPSPSCCSASLKKRGLERSKAQAAEYHKLLVQRIKEQRERRSESLAKKRALRQASVASKEAPAAAAK